MTKQLKFVGISATLVCLGLSVAFIAPGRANSVKTSQRVTTESILNTRDLDGLNSLKADQQVTTSLQNKSEAKPVRRRLALDGDLDSRGQLQEIVEERINALSPLKQRTFLQKHFPVILSQKPKTGLKKIYKSSNGVILKKEYRNGQVKYFDKSGSYLKQKNTDGSWEFKTGYSTEKDWHLGII